MRKTIKSFALFASAVFLLAVAGCKKGTFDINDVNPNQPSNVSPKFLLSGTLKNTAGLVAGGDQDFANIYMGYYALSGDYIPNTQTLTYTTNTDYFSDEWNSGYLDLKNYRQMEVLAEATGTGDNYIAIGKIMEAYHLFQMVDLYNNVPNFQALNGGVVDFPGYDPALTVYTSAFNKIDSAITIINAAPATAENPLAFDVMFGGDMSAWIAFANTLKLKAALNLTKSSGGISLAQKEVAGLSSNDFLGTGMDATINPGYSNSSNAQQSPVYGDMGLTTSGSLQGGVSYYRACSYAVNFLNNTSDPRISYFYTPASASGTIKGRAFGSTTSDGEDNQHISAIGPGVLKGPSDAAAIITAAESFFLQADAVQEGLLTGDAKSLYNTAVAESFRYLGVGSSADAFTSGPDSRVNYDLASDKLKLIVTQEWVALNRLDPIESWNNWKRLSIPADLPVSIFPGATAGHVPYRLLYPTSEYSYNTANVNAQGTVSNITSKIFWMP